MPYYRTYNRRRPMRYRRRYNRKKPVQQQGYLATASKALSLASKVASIVNAEKFHFDASSAAAVSTTPAIVPLQLIPEGDDTQTRTGRSIKLAGLLFKLFLSSPSTATEIAYVRCMMVIDRWSQGAAPAITDILTASTVQAFRNVDTMSAKRFSVIYDKTVGLTITGGEDSTIVLKKYFPLKHHLKFINTTGVQAATGAGQVYFIIFANSVASNACTYSLNTRSWYYDN